MNLPRNLARYFCPVKNAERQPLNTFEVSGCDSDGVFPVPGCENHGCTVDKESSQLKSCASDSTLLPVVPVLEVLLVTS